MRAQGKKETEVLLTRVTSCLPSSTPTKHVYVLWCHEVLRAPCRCPRWDSYYPEEKGGGGWEELYTESRGFSV